MMAVMLMVLNCDPYSVLHARLWALLGFVGKIQVPLKIHFIELDFHRIYELFHSIENSSSKFHSDDVIKLGRFLYFHLT